MMRSFRLPVTVLVLVGLLAAGCGPEDAGGSTNQSNKDNGGASAGCQQPGPRTFDLLASFPPTTYTTIQNPCVGFASLLAQVTELIPEVDRTTKTEVKKFTEHVDTFAGNLAKLGDVVECGYRTDRLAMAIYQDKQTLWSVGIVGVVRGDIDAVTQVSACFLLQQLPFGAGDIFRDGSTRPQPKFCADTRRRQKDNESYTMVWLASSDVMCRSLAAQLSPGKGSSGKVSATVKATPDVAIRSGPSTSTSVVARAQPGQIVTVMCYSKGENISGRRGSGDTWDRVTAGDVTGYISDVWLDTGGDIRTQTKDCAA
jgi:hypothetical protein